MTDTTTETEQDETTELEVEQTGDADTIEPGSEDTTEPETFPLAYVQKLRQEAAEHRTRAADRDSLAERLHAAQVAALGRLADPSDLAYSEDLLDPEALTAAVDDILARKPHLASRRPSGDVGQGTTGTADTVDLAGILRSRA